MKYQIQTIISFIWIGCVCSISFMEAWVKFLVDQVTLSIGLSIGQLVFEVLNRMEWVFALIILGFFVFRKESYARLVFYLIPLVILIMQTFYFLPELQVRVQTILAGNKLTPSPVHFFYIGLEVVKVVSLFIFGFISLSKLQNVEKKV